MFEKEIIQNLPNLFGSNRFGLVRSSYAGIYMQGIITSIILNENACEIRLVN